MLVYLSKVSIAFFTFVSRSFDSFRLYLTIPHDPAEAIIPENFSVSRGKRDFF